MATQNSGNEHVPGANDAALDKIIPDQSNQPTQVRLSWVTPEQQKANYDAAIAAAKQAQANRSGSSPR